MNSKAVQKYLSDHAEKNAIKHSKTIAGTFSHCVAIPARNETQYLSRCLESLEKAATQEQGTVLVVVIVNQPEIGFEEERANNLLVLNFLEASAIPGSKKEEFKAAKRFIAISECTKKDLMDAFSIPEDSIDVIYHGVNHTIFNAHSQSQQKKMAQPYFLYVGGRLNHKNFTRFLEAYAGSPVNRDYQLAVIGTPWNDEELELLQKWGVEKKVINLGHATNVELAELYRGTTAFIMPSLYEGFGMPIVEAMASGAPMGLSSTGPMPEIGAQAALYFDPKNPAEMASVLEALTDEATRSKLKNIGLKRIGPINRYFLVG